MKYIVTVNDKGREEIFAFPLTVNHDCMAEVLESIRDQMTGNWEREFRKPVSAGFINAENKCHGESITLGLKSRPERDTELLVLQLRISL